MKGISFEEDKKHKKRFVKIDLDTLEKYEENLEELYDVIIAESRKDEPTVSWETIKKQLKKKSGVLRN